MHKIKRKRIVSLDYAQYIPAAAALQVQKRKEFGLLPSCANSSRADRIVEESSINNLPSEVLMKIFSNVNQDELVTLCDVCHLWKNIIYDYFSNTPLRSLEFSETTLRMINGTSSSSFNCVTMIDAVLSDSNSAVNLIAVLSRMQNGNLRTLHITIGTSWPREDDEWIIIPLNVTSSARSLGNLEGFQYIDSCNVKLSNALLNALLLLLRNTNRPTLKHFKLEGVCPSVREYAMFSVASAIEAHQSSLTHVTLLHCHFYNESVWGEIVYLLASLEHLHYLDLRTRDRNLKTDLCFIKDMHTSRLSDSMPKDIMLNHLTIEPHSDISMIKFVERRYLKWFLISIELSVEDLNSLVSFLQGYCLPYVQYFVVTDGHDDPDEYTSNFTDDILASIIQCLPGVEYIGAYGCHFLTGEGLVNIITSTPTLEEINLDYCTGITYTELRNVLRDVTVPVRDNSRRIDLRIMAAPYTDGGYTTGRNNNIYVKDEP